MLMKSQGTQSWRFSFFSTFTVVVVACFLVGTDLAEGFIKAVHIPTSTTKGWIRSDACINPFSTRPRIGRRANCLPRPAKKEEDSEEDPIKSPAAEEMLDAASKDPFVFENMTLFGKLDKIINAAALGILLLGFVLNLFGYDFLVKDGKVTIDTTGKRQFQNEVNRVMKESKSTTTVSRQEYTINERQ
ncbi:expressed unknown protein [Seminavis robusta]|uniref:Uncharacterized protein n=1 Tax=Seminavis robusta TaxID=568900 RepID=A0A9N8HA71_9STRA|nr:expressed unknown protein [Seminavis robusta]|eukprot:Sro231_g093710.1 n/a (188) ;mRNA; r:75731-76294